MMLHTNSFSGGPSCHATRHCMQPHMDLEAIVALHCILGDIGAGPQVDLTIQLICLQQEGP